MQTLVSAIRRYDRRGCRAAAAAIRDKAKCAAAAQGLCGDCRRSDPLSEGFFFSSNTQQQGSLSCDLDHIQSGESGCEKSCVQCLLRVPLAYLSSMPASVLPIGL